MYHSLLVSHTGIKKMIYTQMYGLTGITTNLSTQLLTGRKGKNKLLSLCLTARQNEASFQK